VGQCADILACRPELVPVGEDQLPHLELCTYVARRFDQIFCGVNSHTLDKDYVSAGGVFPVIQPKLGRVKRLVGTGGPSPDTGALLKMSKSLNNAIFLSDDPDIVKKKIMAMYTDPNRKKATDPGEIDPAKNPLWAFHEVFNPDKQWVAETEAKYKAGQIGDVDCKRKLIDVLVAIIEPIRQRRLEIEKDPQQVLNVLKTGTARANKIAEETLTLAKEAMKQNFFPRNITF
jgi:tryptophanyl-tRNA synthetase